MPLAIVFYSISLGLFCFVSAKSWSRFFAPLEAFLAKIKVRLETQDQRAVVLLKGVYQIERGSSIGSNSLPRYKDFTNQLELLLGLHRRLGIPLQKALKKWKDALARERRKDREFKRTLYQGHAQAFVMMVVIWGFMGISLSLYDLTIPSSLLLFCLATPLLGLVIYHGVLKWWLVRLFKGIEHFERVLSRLDVLKSSGLCANEVVDYLEFDSLEREKGGELITLREHFFTLIHDWRTRGVPLTEELGSLRDELDFLYQQAQDRFVKGQAVIKLVVLFTFFLLPYLAYLVGMVSLFLKDL